MKTASTTFLPFLATMLLSVCITLFARADRAENAFVIVEGDGVVRLDGKNFAVLSDGADSETIVTITPQPGWQLLSPSRVKVKAGSPIPFQARSKSMEETVNGRMTTIRIELTAYGCCRYVNGEEGAWDAAAEIPVPENKEENPGAFIHWNIDNDNNSTGGTTKHPGGDYLETTASVAGEDDLKKLTCALWTDGVGEVDCGIATLSLRADSAAIWKSKTKSAENLVVSPGGEKSWDLRNAPERTVFYAIKDSLFVEGVASGECEVEFKYKHDSGKEIADVVKYTFIAANCYQQSSAEIMIKQEDGSLITEKARFKNDHPNLVGCEWSLSRNEPDSYNCLAFSVGETNWIVLETSPRQVPKEGGVFAFDGRTFNVFVIDACFGTQNTNLSYVSTDKLDRFYAKYGYSPTEAANEADIVYYRNGKGGYHAARHKSCPCGSHKWSMYESKIRTGPLIEHLWPQLEGGTYGSKFRFYKKD